LLAPLVGCFFFWAEPPVIVWQLNSRELGWSTFEYPADTSAPQWIFPLFYKRMVLNRSVAFTKDCALGSVYHGQQRRDLPL
jgi:hypothetical protein